MGNNTENNFANLVKAQGVKAEPEAKTPETPEPERKTYRQPSREGTKPYTLHLNEAAHRQLKMLALEKDTTIHDILVGALNTTFELNNKPPIA